MRLVWRCLKPFQKTEALTLKDPVQLKKLADIRIEEFIVQAILALSLFLFACINLSVDPKGVMSNFWIAIISTIIGTFMPNPKIKSVKILFKK